MKKILSDRSPVELSKIKALNELFGNVQRKFQDWKYWSSTKKVFEQDLKADGQWLSAKDDDFMVIRGVN